MMGSVESACAHEWPAELELLYVDERVSFVRLAYLLTRRSDVAEEVVQDAFLACAPRWDEIKHPKAYVRTAVTNGCRAWLRKCKLDRDRTPSDDGVHRMVPDEMWDALGRLDERRRVAVVLRFYADLPDSEIAVILDCRPATVRSLVHRGIKDLRREVKR